MSSPSISPAAEQAILDAVRNLDYGSVEITVHDSKVVQIECRKKIRFQNDPASPPFKSRGPSRDY